MPERRKTGHIFLVGFSGSGKSTVGPLLARRLKRPFFDSDREIVRKTGVPISSFFAGEGEKSFRKLEHEIVRSLVSARGSSVIALGGGALLPLETRRSVFKAGIVVYLRCSRRELHRRLSGQSDRPLLKRKGESLQLRIRKLLQLRRPGYEKAQIIVATTTRTPSQTADRIGVKLSEAGWH
jgi:shikimate kinase